MEIWALKCQIKKRDFGRQHKQTDFYLDVMGGKRGESNFSKQFFIPCCGNVPLKKKKKKRKCSYEIAKRATLGRDGERQISATGSLPGGMASSPHYRILSSMPHSNRLCLPATPTRR